MKRTDFLKLGLGVALTPLVKVLPADAQPLDVVANDGITDVSPSGTPPIYTIFASAASATTHYWREDELMPRLKAMTGIAPYA